MMAFNKGVELTSRTLTRPPPITPAVIPPKQSTKGAIVQFTYEFTRLLITHFRECFIFSRDVMGFTPTFGTENDTYADLATGMVNIALFDKRETHTPGRSSDAPAYASRALSF